VVVDSVKKGQQERSTLILSRALQMCKDKQVSIYTPDFDFDLLCSRNWVWILTEVISQILPMEFGFPS